ncbi:MAG: acetylglutamate kinase, partial [Candidatus Dormibacteraceae bacterium]
MSVEVADRAQVLIEALPYIRRLHGRVVVIKLGGRAMEERRAETLLDIVLLRYVGMCPVIVHGGGSEITAMSERLGLTSEFQDGLRVTDERTIEVVKMVLTGKVNPELVATLNRLGA